MAAAGVCRFRRLRGTSVVVPVAGNAAVAGRYLRGLSGGRRTGDYCTAV